MIEGNGLYSRDEISVMTDSALDELIGHYRDTGNYEGVQRAQDELDVREDDRAAELEHEMEQERQQIMHDEMINDMLAQDGRWG